MNSNFEWKFYSREYFSIYTLKMGVASEKNFEFYKFKFPMLTNNKLNYKILFQIKLLQLLKLLLKNNNVKKNIF